MTPFDYLKALWKTLRKERVPPAPDLRDGATIYHLGGGWGNRIQWFTPGRIVVGWKATRPQVGDGIASPMQSGQTMVYLITSVERAQGVWDMFFADVVPLRYMEYTEKPHA